ncbi:hypothetical protein BCR42DRAFT_411691 [Absidia repens]|uniref:Transcription factor domain-containing protein n=1 Tax=Absidia repens TaxID=90262 RepID=A0A1X2IM35_9FUNG|nr:hypothetical protein BCR42DRAFT_411691 [Absidia repens]
MLTPVFDFLQLQQQQQDDSPTNDLNSSVEATLYAYLHDQPCSLDSPLPVSTIYSNPNYSSSLNSNHVTPSPPCQASDYCSNESDSFYVNNDNYSISSNIFRSPQLPVQEQQQQQMLVESEGLLDYPPATSLQHLPVSMPFDFWGHPLLDMLQGTNTMGQTMNEGGSGCSGNSNNNEFTVDPAIIELLTSLSNNANSSGTATATNTANPAINMEINSFTDLLQAIERMQIQLKQPDTAADIPQHQLQQQRRPYKKRKSQHPAAISSVTNQQPRQQLMTPTTMMKKLPAVVHDTVNTFLPTLMEKAQSHWCCVGFKVAPVTLDMIQNWRQAPVTIVYSYVKTAAMEFYEQARRKMDDIVFDDENDISNYNGDEMDYEYDDNYDTGGALTDQGRQKAMTIQSYFCLSYTSNLLRLYEQQRTWGGLASIALQLRTKDVETGCRPMDQAILLCYCRWYYVDAWMSLTLGRDCLLPDDPPRFIMDAIQPPPSPHLQDEQQPTSPSPQPLPLVQRQTTTTIVFPHEHQSLYQFAMLTKFMRRYIQVMQSGKLVDPITKKPSLHYYQITTELKQWYSMIEQQEENEHTNDFRRGPNNSGNGNANAHLHLCYHAMRLMILYKLLHPDLARPDDVTLMDGLDTNLALLLALQQLASQGCDQSTYHHMFFAIHNMASRIHQHHTRHRISKWQKWARQQLQLNLVLLKGTQAYVNDVFQMRVYAEKIEQQFVHMGLRLSACYQSILSSMEQQQSLLQHQRRHVTNHRNEAEHKKKQSDSSVVVPAKTTTTTSSSGQQQQQCNKQQLGLGTELTLEFTHGHPTTTPAPSPSTTPTTKLNKSTASSSSSSTSGGVLPGMHIYKLHKTASIKKPRKNVKAKQTKQ